MPARPDGMPPAEAAAAAVRAAPGDTVIIGFTTAVTQDEADRLREQWEARVPGIRLVIVADARADAMKALRADGTTEAAVRLTPAPPDSNGHP